MNGQIPPGDQILTEKRSISFATGVARTFFEPKQIVESNLALVAVHIAFSRLM